MSVCACANHPRSCTSVYSASSGDFESCKGLIGKSSPVRERLIAILQGILNAEWVLSGKSCAQYYSCATEHPRPMNIAEVGTASQLAYNEIHEALYISFMSFILLTNLCCCVNQVVVC